MIKGKLDVGDNGRAGFWCPGCKDPHYIAVAPARVQGAAWGSNGDYNFPTFTPSVLYKSGHYVGDGKPGDCWCSWPDEEKAEWGGLGCVICHSFVTNGQIQFLSDCTHELAGQTVPLPEWPEGQKL